MNSQKGKVLAGQLVENVAMANAYGYGSGNGNGDGSGYGTDEDSNPADFAALVRNMKKNYETSTKMGN